MYMLQILLSLVVLNGICLGLIENDFQVNTVLACPPCL